MEVESLRRGRSWGAGGKKRWAFRYFPILLRLTWTLAFNNFFNYTFVFYVMFCMCMLVYNLNPRKGGRRKEIKPLVTAPVASRDLDWNWGSMSLKSNSRAAAWFLNLITVAEVSVPLEASSEGHSCKFTLDTLPSSIPSNDW